MRLCFIVFPMTSAADIDKFISQWRDTGGT